MPPLSSADGFDVRQARPSADGFRRHPQDGGGFLGAVKRFDVIWAVGFHFSPHAVTGPTLSWPALVWLIGWIGSGDPAFRQRLSESMTPGRFIWTDGLARDFVAGRESTPVRRASCPCVRAGLDPLAEGVNEGGVSALRSSGVKKASSAGKARAAARRIDRGAFICLSLK